MPDHISVSQINLFLMCPLKYRFNYVDGLPKPFKPADLAFGSSIHAAVEWWHRHRTNGTEPGWQDTVRIFEADMQAQSFETLNFKNGDSLESLLEKGKQLLAVYLKNFKGEAVRAVELPFRVPLIDPETGEALEVPLDGYIDLIETDDTIVELKTAAKVYSLIELVQHIQITAYDYAFRWLYNRKPKLRIDILTKGNNPAMHSFELSRDEKSLVRFIHIAKAVLKAIQSGQFYPNEGWQCPGASISRSARNGDHEERRHICRSKK